MGKLLIAATSALGGVGLGLSLGYLLLVVSAFHPQGGVISEFLIGSGDGTPGFGFALVVVPYVLLTMHLFGRVKLAGVLVDRGELTLAESYATRRLRVSPLRAAREVLANRIALMRIALRRQDYELVETIAAQAELPKPRKLGGPVPEVVAFHRWRLEGALRRENLLDAREIVDTAWPISATGGHAGAFCACAAELAVRNGDPSEFDNWRERAAFADPDSDRMQVSELLAALKFGRAPSPAPPHDPAWLEEVPGATAEYTAVRGALTNDLPSNFDELPSDARSRHVVAKLTTK